MVLSPSEFRDLRRLVDRLVDGEALEPEDERRFRQILAKEHPPTRDMDWAELIRFAKLCVGVHRLMPPPGFPPELGGHGRAGA